MGKVAFTARRSGARSSEEEDVAGSNPAADAAASLVYHDCRHPTPPLFAVGTFRRRHDARGTMEMEEAAAAAAAAVAAARIAAPEVLRIV